MKFLFCFAVIILRILICFALHFDPIRDDSVIPELSNNEFIQSQDPEDFENRDDNLNPVRPFSSSRRWYLQEKNSLSTANVIPPPQSINQLSPFQENPSVPLRVGRYRPNFRSSFRRGNPPGFFRQDRFLRNGLERRDRRFQFPLPFTSLSTGLDSILLKLTNQFRGSYGLRPLCLNLKLSQVARDQCFSQQSLGRMTHDSPDGVSLGTRVNRFGFRWQSCAENVASGQSSPNQVMRDWENSPGHRANILGPYRYFGAAKVGIYWTQDFANSLTNENCSN